MISEPYCLIKGMGGEVSETSLSMKTMLLNECIIVIVVN